MSFFASCVRITLPDRFTTLCFLSNLSVSCLCLHVAHSEAGQLVQYHATSNSASQLSHAIVDCAGGTTEGCLELMIFGVYLLKKVMHN